MCDPIDRNREESGVGNEHLLNANRSWIASFDRDAISQETLLKLGEAEDEVLDYLWCRVSARASVKDRLKLCHEERNINLQGLRWVGGSLCPGIFAELWEEDPAHEL
jgi:hypothetical protein